ncbi:MAG: manganese efflux pump [Bacteroidales bacterium]|nr:manganese efflux pump [Bacteroidales bacterium]
MFLDILFIIALTFPVAAASTAFGSINNEQCTMNNVQRWGRNLMFALVLALGQGLMYYLGSLLGGTFMHLLTKLSKWIIFALCFSVAYRMLLNTLKIKKGENLYFIETKKQLLLLSIALGVNAFIVGLMYEFMPMFHYYTPCIMMIVAFVWAIVMMLIPFSKMKLTFNSLLNLIFAAVILVRGLLILV